MGGALENNQPKSNRGGARPGGGRPKGSPNKATADIRALASKHGPAVIAELVRLSTSAESEQARIAAAKEILDRGYGKSPQPLTGEGGQGPMSLIVATGVPRDRADS